MGKEDKVFLERLERHHDELRSIWSCMTMIPCLLSLATI